MPARTLLAGRPGMGKTAFALNIATNAAYLRPLRIAQIKALFDAYRQFYEQAPDRAAARAFVRLYSDTVAPLHRSRAASTSSSPGAASTR